MQEGHSVLIYARLSRLVAQIAKDVERNLLAEGGVAVGVAEEELGSDEHLEHLASVNERDVSTFQAVGGVLGAHLALRNESRVHGRVLRGDQVMRVWRVPDRSVNAEAFV